VKKRGRGGVVDAREKGHIIGGLEEAEVIQDGFIAGLQCGEGRVRADVGAESLLQMQLAVEEGVEEGELFGCDGAAIGTRS